MTSVKIWIKGKLPLEINGVRTRNRRQFHDGEIEIYSRGRYFTVTSMHLETTPLSIEDRQAELESLHSELFPPNKKPNGNRVSVGGTFSISDRELIEKASAAKSGAKFSRLWHGDTSGHD